jgi:hypothetical protein
MPDGQSGFRRWSNWTIHVKVKAWKVLVALLLAPILVLWFLVVHQKDDILALSRNEVVQGTSGRMWVGSFVNTNDKPLRDVGVTVEFLDSANRRVGKADAVAAELPFGARLDLQAPLPADAARMRIYSVQWRMGSTAALMGPFREPWEFGYLMIDPAALR